MPDTQDCPYRIAPPGFTPEQREQFDREGILHFENAISADDLARYLEVIERHLAADPKYDPTQFYASENLVERDPVYAELIDHPRHVGFVYDIFGELLKLHVSQLFVRPKGGNRNMWHPDGARAVPYGVFCPVLPIQVKVALWLTDISRPRMGNLVVRPGSQHQQYFDGYDTHQSAPDEQIVCVPAGTMTLMNGSVWHRVEPNESDVVRKNIFLAYCPSWVVAADRLQNDPAWLETLTRERRIIMRSYSYAYDHTKPPARDFPLFLDRDTGLDHDPGRYAPQVALHRRKRMVAHEKVAHEKVSKAPAAVSQP